MRHTREWIIDTCRRMKVGQCVQYERWEFNEGFGRPNFGLLEGISPVDDFMENMIGSTYGTYRITDDPFNGRLTISRHDEDDRVHHVSPDRRHLFDKQSDGTFKRNETPHK